MSSDSSETVRRIVVSEEKCSIFSLKLLDQCLKSLKTAKDISITFNGEAVTLNVDQQVFSFKALKENQATDCFREIEVGRNDWVWEEIGQVQSKLQPQRQLGLVRETVRQKTTEEENRRNQHKSMEYQSSVSKGHSLIKKGTRPLAKTPRSIPTKPTVPNRLLPPRPTPTTVKPVTPAPSTSANSSSTPPPSHPVPLNQNVPSPTPPPTVVPKVPAVVTPPPVPNPAPTQPPPTILTPSSTSTTPSIVNNSKPSQSSNPPEPTTTQITPSSEEDLRKRIIQMLAGEELTVDNVISRFTSPGDLVKKIVREVATMNSAWLWNLKDKFFQQVDPEWPDYTAEVREKVRSKKQKIVVVEEQKTVNRHPPQSNPSNRQRSQRPVTAEKPNQVPFVHKYGTIPKTILTDTDYKEGCNKFNQIYKDYSKLFDELNSNRQLFLDFERRWKGRSSEEEKLKLKNQIQHEYTRRAPNVKQKRSQYRALHQILNPLKQQLVDYAKKQQSLQQNAISRT